MLPERLARRAAWEVKHGNPGLARSLLLRGARAATDEMRVHLLEQALDVCADYFPSESEEARETAELLIQASNATDARAHKALAIYHSLKAREAYDRQDPARAFERFDRAKESFERALELLPEDADARASLGGLHRRAAGWCEDPETRIAHEDAALRAYELAAVDGSCPYAVLNAIELGAVVRYTRAVDAATARAAGGRFSRPDAQLFAGGGAEIDEQRARLRRALFIREQQFRRGEDRPWPAFDLARGRHYLRPNVPRLLADLEVAIDEVRRIARGSSDAWMLHSAARTFHELCAIELPVDGLDDGLVALKRAAHDDRWSSGDFGPPPGVERYLAVELAEVSTRIEGMHRTLAESAKAHEVVEGFVQETRKRWSVDDEDRFQAEVDVFLKAIEPAHKKALRAVWKIGGSAAVELAMEALVPGATAAKIAGGVAEALVERALKEP